MARRHTTGGDTTKCHTSGGGLTRNDITGYEKTGCDTNVGGANGADINRGDKASYETPKGDTTKMTSLDVKRTEVTQMKKVQTAEETLLLMKRLKVIHFRVEQTELT